jgi:2-polyprenyl-3-methyl-5-hydroxy-6-metoxy-1,4-benzoquinol methylase
MTTTVPAPATVLDEARVERFAGLLVTEAGAAVNAALVVIGDRLGLYRAMADGRPVTPAVLAAATGTHERYVREWLCAQAASGFVEHDPATDAFTLPAEHAFVLADDQSPVALAGLFQAATAAVGARDRMAERFRTGRGLGWHEHDHDLFDGTERLFGGTYRGQLVPAWIAAIDGLREALERGITVADVGCGHGISTILMAEAYPQSTFVGFDYHEASIEKARHLAAMAGVEDRVRFELATATDFPGWGYDLVACFDALHDMGDPAAASRHIWSALAEDGTWMIVEPSAGDSPEENFNPLGRIRYGFSTLVCTPGSLSQPGRAGLGTLAGERRLAEVIRAGGFAQVRRAAETPFNMVLEARA